MTDKLATRTPEGLAAPDPYVPSTFTELMQICGNIAKTRLFGITSPEQAFVVLSAGHELGLSQIQSLRALYSYDGKLGLYADGIAAIVLRSGLAEYFREVATTDTESTWETRRRGEPAKRYTYTIADATKAGLVRPSSNWTRSPKRMLAARAKSFLGRDVFPDLLLGMYTVEELMDVTPPPAGEPERPIVEMPPQAPPAPASEPPAATAPAGTSEQAEQLRGLIAAARVEELPRLSELVRLNFPKGHEERASLADAVRMRKAEVSDVG